MGLVEVVAPGGYKTPCGLIYHFGDQIERPWMECKLGKVNGKLRIIEKIKLEEN